MMAALDDAGAQKEVDNVVVRGCISKEYAFEVLAVQLPTPNAQHLNADAGAEELQVANVGLMAIESLDWSLLGYSMHEPVV